MRLIGLAGVVLALGFSAGLPAAAIAENKPVNIGPGVMSVQIETGTGPVEISRIQDNQNRLSGDWARTSRPCPNFCVQPMIPAEGVTPIGELEVIAMLQDPAAVVVDSRVAKWYYDGTIPGAEHIPFTEVADRLDELGCEIDFDGWICNDAKSVALFCNGPWCGQSPTAIRAMISVGYPADKIYYYRGGMQAWRMLGLTVIEPKDG
ncbi:MAG: rhodanese-like domain-containing protein [Marinosulfonomonas sp.]|nr:rhodanese-like domain-containing protein [Marinosulfonomonas sp.]